MKNKKSNDIPFLEIFSMINKPTEFFKKEISVSWGLLYFIIADLIFTTLTQTLVFYHITDSVLQTEFAMSIVINFLSIIAGFFMISAIIIAINTILGGKKSFQIFALLLYSIVPPLLLFWIPFIFLQFIFLFWSMALILIGIHIKEGFSYKKSMLFPLLFIILALFLTYISRNYILLGFLK